MACCLKYLSCLLLSLSAGFATYALGAVVWCVIDPTGAGAKLLFTIPVAIAGLTIPGIVGMLCLAFRCDWIPEPKPAKETATPQPAPTPSAADPHPPTRKPRSRPATAPATTPVDDDLELVLAT